MLFSRCMWHKAEVNTTDYVAKPVCGLTKQQIPSLCRERAIMKTNYVLEDLYESKENILKLNTSSDMKAEFQGDVKTPFSHGKEQYNNLNLSCYKPTELGKNQGLYSLYENSRGEQREDFIRVLLLLHSPATSCSRSWTRQHYKADGKDK